MLMKFPTPYEIGIIDGGHKHLVEKRTYDMATNFHSKQCDMAKTKFKLLREGLTNLIKIYD